MTVHEFTGELKSRAAELGFILSGVTAAAQPPRYQEFLKWLDAGMAGDMRYLPTRRQAYASPNSILDGCTTLVMLAYPYRTAEPPTIANGTGRVARYAWGQPDYHDHVFDRLQTLQVWVQARYPEARLRGVIDTAPLLEREFAESAGLGWVGKNTLLLNRQWGSYFFLAALLTDLPLTIDEPLEKGFCGTCRACLDACPTGAFPESYVLDARRCISYLTIEYRDTIEPQLAAQLGDWIFGCDICQEVCPWNRRIHLSNEAIPQPDASLTPADLIELISLDENQFRQRYRKTPLWRAKRRGVIRNACLVLGNQRHASAIPALEALLNDQEELIQGAAKWALDRIRSTGFQPVPP